MGRLRNIGRLRAGGGSAASVVASSRTLVAEGDSISAANAAGGGYASIYEGNANPQFTSFNVTGVAGSTIAFLNNRAAANDAKMVAGGANIYTVMIGRNEAITTGPGQSAYLTAMAAHCDARRAAGWFVIICTILPSTPVGFNAGRAILNTEMRLWPTGGSTVPGIHCDAICDFDTTTMGADADASDVAKYSDGTHPTLAGQVLLEAKYRTVVNAATPAAFTASPTTSVAGGVYGTSQNVTLASATTGADIYYTLDSADPTTASTLYAGETIVVAADETIRAIATKAGKSNSAISESIYTFGTAPASGCVAWYKYDAGQNIVSGKVARWEDRLLGRHISQATLTKRPAYSAGLVTFDGTDDYLTKIFTLAQPCTVYGLVRQDTWAGIQVVFGGASGGAAVYQHSSSPGLTGYAGSFGTQDSNATIGSFFPVCLVLNGASSSLRVANNAKVTNNLGTQAMTGLTLGATGSGGQAAAVTFKEVTLFNTAHSDAEQDAEITRMLAI